MDQPQYPEVLEDLKDKLTELLREEGIDDKPAGEIAFRATEMVRLDWGGLNLYIPKGRPLGPSDRDLEIYRRFSVENRDHLCKEFGITTQRLYQILSAVDDYMLKKNQLKLFEDDDDSADEEE